jgi:hypothetical protein
LKFWKAKKNQGTMNDAAFSLLTPEQQAAELRRAQQEDEQRNDQITTTKKGMTMMNELKLTPAQQIALTTILNLRRLTEETATRTTRAQNDILRALNSVDLAAVANALAK